jgi:hypothetical protein
MEQTFRRVGTHIRIGLYLVWILGVIAWAVTKLTPDPVPAVVNWIVVTGTAIATVIGAIQIIY